MSHEPLDREHDRIRDDVKEAAKARNEDSDVPWRFQWEIPSETNGWIYVGDQGSLARSETWVDQFPNPTEAIGVIKSPTHPRDDSCDKMKVFHVTDMSEKIDSRENITTFEGEPYKTPLHVSERMFWEAVEAAIEYMEENEP